MRRILCPLLRSWKLIKKSDVFQRRNSGINFTFYLQDKQEYMHKIKNVNFFNLCYIWLLKQQLLQIYYMPIFRIMQYIMVSIKITICQQSLFSVI